MLWQQQLYYGRAFYELRVAFLPNKRLGLTLAPKQLELWYRGSRALYDLQNK